ncbi:hypothetical protein QTN47_15250 [Danxiaibacter flavus]|uniref:Outer membrane protein n=1 Tax=Danxiaibacter flavus TaxID=3049108 RepID=A0ABV3ZK15_9BACT|nr:hypothetical protein QNM32_15260 [Chitinophagaceae bacterium DXS]
MEISVQQPLTLKKKIALFFPGLCCLLLAYGQPSQDSTKPDNNVSFIGDKALRQIDQKYQSLTNAINENTMHCLVQMQRKEEKLQRKLAGKDSTKAKELFAGSESTYQDLRNKLKAPLDKSIANPLKEYIPGMDSLQTAMRFLEQNGTKLPLEQLQKVKQISGQLQELQGKLQQANEIQSFIRQKEQELKQQLTQFGLGKELLGINKQVVYYQQQLSEYKNLLNNRRKLEDKAISLVRELPAFKEFMQQNSMLAQLFGIPANYGTPQALEGLQTRAQVEGMISQRLGLPLNTNSPMGGGANAEAFMQQQVQQAESQMNELKNKLNRLTGGSSDMTMPDFRPNKQKTKSFLKRLEYGLTIQTSGVTNYLPTIADIAVQLGYKLSDKAVMGIGASYKLGLGKGWEKLALSNEGVGLRSYMDIKAKGSIWLSAGFEYNYMRAFSSLRALPSPAAQNINLWQRSVLAGVTKKYKIGTKKEGRMQLLYDFIAAQQVPRAQILKFRIGYGF